MAIENPLIRGAESAPSTSPAEQPKVADVSRWKRPFRRRRAEAQVPMASVTNISDEQQPYEHSDIQQVNSAVEGIDFSSWMGLRQTEAKRAEKEMKRRQALLARQRKAEKARSVRLALEKTDAPVYKFWQIEEKRAAEPTAAPIFQAYLDNQRADSVRKNVNIQPTNTDTTAAVQVTEAEKTANPDEFELTRRHQHYREFRRAHRAARQRFGKEGTRSLKEITGIKTTDVFKARAEWTASAALNIASDAFSSTVVPFTGGAVGTAMVASQLNVESNPLKLAAFGAFLYSYEKILKKVFVHGGAENWKLRKVTGDSTVLLSKLLGDFGRAVAEKAKRVSKKAKVKTLHASENTENAGNAIADRFKHVIAKVNEKTQKAKENAEEIGAKAGYALWHGGWEIPILLKTANEYQVAGAGRASIFFLSANIVGWIWNSQKIKISEAVRHSQDTGERFLKYVARRTKEEWTRENIKNRIIKRGNLIKEKWTPGNVAERTKARWERTTDRLSRIKGRFTRTPNVTESQEISQYGSPAEEEAISRAITVFPEEPNQSGYEAVN